MAIWSLATQLQDDGVIDVSLYPSEYRAYAALANFVFEYAGEEGPTKEEAFLKQLRELPAGTFKMEIIQDALNEIGMKATVTRHQSPSPILFQPGMALMGRSTATKA